jgi:hypothetical protein
LDYDRVRYHNSEAGKTVKVLNFLAGRYSEPSGDCKRRQRHGGAFQLLATILLLITARFYAAQR